MIYPFEGVSEIDPKVHKVYTVSIDNVGEMDVAATLAQSIEMGNLEGHEIKYSRNIQPGDKFFFSPTEIVTAS